VVADADGSHARAITGGPWDDETPSWSADGTRIAFSSDRGGDDRIGGGGHDVIYGGPGNDVLDGSDELLARDGEADVVDCGPGRDIAAADPTDVVESSRERR
jgi:Ca2+-binding RTX toxin-like protein